MRYRVAVMMEIDPFLSNRGGHEHEEPKGRVERRTNAFLSRPCRTAVVCGRRFFIIAIIAKPHGEAYPHRFRRELHAAGIGRRRHVIYTEGRSADGQCGDHFRSNFLGAFLNGTCCEAKRLAEQMSILVEDSLKPACVGILKYALPVRLAPELRANSLGHFRMVEKC